MIRRPRIVKGWVVNKTQGRTIRNVIGSVGGQPTTIQLTTVNLTAEQLSLRDGPSEKLWGGGGRGIFEPQEFIFVIKFLV